MSTPRRRRREGMQSHIDFPTEYATLLERIAANGRCLLGPMSPAEAVATQCQLYRYFGFLRRAPVDDELAAHLNEIARTVKCSRLTNEDGTQTLDWHLNPVVMLLRNTLRKEPTILQKEPT